MGQSEITCWTVIEAAAAGCAAEREGFAQRYQSVVRAYLATRWCGSSLWLHDLEDAGQDVFVECFKPNGALARAQRDRLGGFRAFLSGVVRNVVRRRETKRDGERLAADDVDLNQFVGDETSLSRVFDRTWAQSLLREAAKRQEGQAKRAGEAALSRFELLRLRFHDGLPIRTIAERWGIEAATLHHDYAKARQEFKAALADVVAFHYPGTPAEIERECVELLDLLK